MRVQKHFIRKLESRTKLVKNFREREKIVPSNVFWNDALNIDS